MVKKPDYAALKELLPSRHFGIGRQIADILNYNKLKSVKGFTYSHNVVHQVMHKDYFDVNVESALILLIEQFYGKPLKLILPDYVRAYPAKTLKMPSTETTVAKN